MRPIAALLLFPVVASLGCSSPLQHHLPDYPSSAASPDGKGYSAGGVAASGATRLRLESWRLADRIQDEPDERQPRPDAVIPIVPGAVSLGSEMERRLLGIARQMREDGRILLRLESRMPDGGSPALNLGIAERAQQLIKTRLVELRVPSRRILLSSLGEEPRSARDRQSGWVELYLVRPSYSARND